MTAAIQRVANEEAYDLIYHDYLASLPEVSRDVMKRSIMNSSRVWMGYEDGKLLCLWGLIPPTLLSDRAYLWLFTTEHLKSHVFVFVRHSQRMVANMLEEFPLIVGHAAVDNDKAIRWLRWLGAKFLDPQGKLIPFEIRAGNDTG